MIGDQWFAVIGILNPSAAAEGLDRGAIIGFGAAETYVVGDDVAPEILYVRTEDGAVDAVRSVLPRHRQPASTRGGRGVATVRRARRPGRRRAPRSRRCSSDSAGSRCSSAASASPT